MSLRLSYEPWYPALTELDVVDADFSEALTMTALARVVLAALHLEHDDLLAAAVADDLAGDHGAGQHGNAGLDVLAVVAEEDLVEFNLAARFANERGELVGAAGFDTILLAAGLDDRVR